MTPVTYQHVCSVLSTVNASNQAYSMAIAIYSISCFHFYNCLLDLAKSEKRILLLNIVLFTLLHGYVENGLRCNTIYMYITNICTIRTFEEKMKCPLYFVGAFSRLTLVKGHLFKGQYLKIEKLFILRQLHKVISYI